MDSISHAIHNFCSNELELNNGTIVCVLVDRTNEMFIKPDTTTLVTLSRINTSRWESSRVEISQISDKDINNVYLANIIMKMLGMVIHRFRDARIQKFKK
jgi:hypothetical protein